MTTESPWNVVLDDNEAQETPCCACKGRGTDRYGSDCEDCGGYGVRW